MNPLPITAPPSVRDFEIFEQHQILFLSTRNIAQKHRLSQTRVRQLITRVADWLADHLPAKTEASREAETRLAQHLAAAQLRRQIEVLQSYFDATGDPKYLRHQTRVIASLARLGIVPGTIDSLAADFTSTDGAGSEPADDRRQPPESLTAHDSPTDNCPVTTDPLSRACSPQPQFHEAATASINDSADLTPDGDDYSDDSDLNPETTLAGLNIMERRLLTLLDETPTGNHDRRTSLSESLADVRRNQAIFQLRLSPNHPGAREAGIPPAQTSSDLPRLPVTSVP